MSRLITVSAVLALACSTSFPAFSQENYLPERATRPGQMNTVQSTFSSTMALDETRDAASQQIEAMQTFYKTAAGSCADVLASVADTCEIFRITTSVSVMETATKGRRLTVNGTVVMKVSFKTASGKPAQ